MARITQGSIVENKHLADTLQWVAEQRRQRDGGRLTKPKISLWEKNRIRMAPACRPDRPHLDMKFPLREDQNNVTLQ